MKVKPARNQSTSRRGDFSPMHPVGVTRIFLCEFFQALRTFLRAAPLLLVFAGCSPSAAPVPDPAPAVDSTGSAAAVKIETAATRDIRCAVTSSTNGCDLYEVSLVELIARPERFEGKRIRALGFVSLGFEDSGLYLSRADWENGVRKNGLWIDEPPPSAEGAKTWLWNKRYVLVEGTFTSADTGHFGMWSGRIMNVQRYSPWRGEDPRPDEKRVVK